MYYPSSERGGVSAGAIVAGFVVVAALAGVVFFLTDSASDSTTTESSVDAQSEVGAELAEQPANVLPFEQDQLPAQTLPGENASADSALDSGDDLLTELGGTVSNTDDCSALNFSIPVPEGWSCRKQEGNATAVTLSTADRKISFTFGQAQGLSACSIIPDCTEEPYALAGFTDVKRFTQSVIGANEILGLYADDSTLEVLVTSTEEFTSEEQTQIQQIADSILVG